MPHDVFISYSSKNKPVADAVCARLEAGGVRCWIAPRDIPPGTEWGAGIVDGIRGSRLLVLIFSEGANGSSQVRREVERAASQDIPILPFRIEDVPLAKSLEYFLSNQHWLDAITLPLAGHIDRLVEAAQRQLGRETLAAPLSVAEPAGGKNGRFRWLTVGVAALATGLLATLLFWLALGRSAGDAPAAASNNAAVPAPPGAAEAQLVGTWGGVVAVAHAAEQSQYPMSLQLERDGSGRLVGSVRYASFPCAGVWNLETQEGDTYRFRETIIERRDRCENNVLATVQPVQDGQYLQVRVHPADRPDLGGRGTLSRVP